MSAAKHTPRPWHAEHNRSNRDSFNVYAPDPSAHASEGDLTIIAEYLTEANAKLIAAAPALADALVDADTLMQCECTPKERESGHLTDCWLPHLRERIHAALRAAGRLP